MRELTRHGVKTWVRVRKLRDILRLGLAALETGVFGVFVWTERSSAFRRCCYIASDFNTFFLFLSYLGINYFVQTK
jgi:hypothetical protein